MSLHNIMLRSGIAGSYGNFMFNFWETTKQQTHILHVRWTKLLSSPLFKAWPCRLNSAPLFHFMYSTFWPATGITVLHIDPDHLPPSASSLPLPEKELVDYYLNEPKKVSACWPLFCLFLHHRLGHLAQKSDCSKLTFLQIQLLIF